MKHIVYTEIHLNFGECSIQDLIDIMDKYKDYGLDKSYIYSLQDGGEMYLRLWKERECTKEEISLINEYCTISEALRVNKAILENRNIFIKECSVDVIFSTLVEINYYEEENNNFKKQLEEVKTKLGDCTIGIDYIEYEIKTQNYEQR